jgi:hypothetical protein
MKRAIVLTLMGGLLVGVLGSTVSAQPTTFRAVLRAATRYPLGIPVREASRPSG